MSPNVQMPAVGAEEDVAAPVGEAATPTIGGHSR